MQSLNLNLLVNKYALTEYDLDLLWVCTGTLCNWHKYYNHNHLAKCLFLSFQTVIIVDLALESNIMDAITQLLLAVLHLAKLYIQNSL